jgi:protein tyrosine/serine phosphatase
MSYAVVRLCLSSLLLGLTLAPIHADTRQDAIARAPIQRFQRVDEHLYRGAQPDAEGFRYLRDLGVRTIVNLRDDESAVAERQLVESLGMHYVNLPMNVGNFFSRSRSIPVDAIREFFALMEGVIVPAVAPPSSASPAVSPASSGPNGGGGITPGGLAAAPVFIHCKRGADRTGAMVAFYRIRNHGWTAARAYAEAREIGMRAWYNGLKRQIEAFGDRNLRTH